ncbi:hypothetical protein EJ02DRAFT_427251 [Clathrospora elynae]|uniref:Uncharacterized protein n=1 Tax=Clathrospora elynae TaxID=706981 RepID=A0A6A5S9L0_9PLEO|nr:hypothetical protein EJ02DRAFT_427251 [Clathrospora elynae]
MAQIVPCTRSNSLTPAPEDAMLGSGAFSIPKTVRQFNIQAPLVEATLHQYLPRHVATVVVRHICGVTALACITGGLQHELQKTRAAEVAADARRKQKKQRLGIGGGPIYAEDARNMIQQRDEDDIARGKHELHIKKLREVTRIANRYKRVMPSVQNLAKKYLKRVKDGLVVTRNVSKWQYDCNNNAYNYRRQLNWEKISLPSSHKYSCPIIDDTTAAIVVAGKVCKAVDPYLLMVPILQKARLDMATVQQRKQMATQDSGYSS